VGWGGLFGDGCNSAPPRPPLGCAPDSICFVLPEKDGHGEGAKLSDCVLLMKGIQTLPCTISPGFVAFIKERIYSRGY
jgi:hypothetical protein